MLRQQDGWNAPSGTLQLVSPLTPLADHVARVRSVWLDFT
mgnify:CR=1 FL=1